MPYALIMAGGVGQRLWPLSRTLRPKQSLALGDDRPLLRQALDRLLPEIDVTEVFVITTADQGDLTRQILPELPEGNLLLEPVGRNTAPCIGYGATVIQRRDPEATMVVVSADHVIRPTDAFLDAVRAGCRAVEEDPRALVALCVAPTGISSQLGHVRRGDKVGAYSGANVYEAAEFIEKPPPDEAQRLVVRGDVFWNTGIFVWKAARVLEELATHRPALAAGLAHVERALGTRERDAVVQREYAAFEPISIDYAVMERAEKVLLVEGRFLWDDVGTWNSLAKVYADDGAGNVVLGRHLGLDTTNCVIAAQPGQLIGTIGVSDLVIVQTADAVLVCSRERAAEVRQLVDRLKAEGLSQFL
jgi:mannose-1-phosphate guanylyltransferase